MNFGLPGMRERASRIGATLSMTSTPGAGPPSSWLCRVAPSSAGRRRSALSGSFGRRSLGPRRPS